VRKVVAVIPIKTASQCKQRLSTVLDAHARHELVELMLNRVVVAVAGVDVIDATYIVSNDSSLVPSHAKQLSDPGTGLNGALASAAAQLRGHAETMLILPADIPLITSADVTRLVELGESNRMVIVADALRSGTNALLVSPPTLLAPRFGPGSFSAHLRAALEADVRAMVHDCPRIARDIDEPRDIAWLLKHSSDPALDFLRSVPTALAG
jgi:2-phospho-L-lactate guanylyltransferase